MKCRKAITLRYTLISLFLTEELIKIEKHKEYILSSQRHMDDQVRRNCRLDKNRHCRIFRDFLVSLAQVGNPAI